MRGGHGGERQWSREASLASVVVETVMLKLTHYYFEFLFAYIVVLYKV